MPIEFEKPAPLMLGDKAYYTLTSYDPIQIEVTVPRVTAADVEYAYATFLAASGATPDDLANPAWFAENTPGISSEEELQAYIRTELAQLNAEVVEEQKFSLCMAELTSRLRQAVPQSILAQTREEVETSFMQRIAADGLTPEQFLMRSGITRAQLSDMLDEQALSAAEQAAALDSYAREKKMSVSDEEIPGLLGLSEEQYASLSSQARTFGRFDQLREVALRTKAAQEVVSTCLCTYHHETPEEAARRVHQVQSMRDGFMSKDDEGEDESPSSNGAGLHLV